MNFKQTNMSKKESYDAGASWGSQKSFMQEHQA